jgi:hypothetical protein
LFSIASFTRGAMMWMFSPMISTEAPFNPSAQGSIQ